MPCYSPPIEVTISKFGTEMHLSTVLIPTNFGLDWNWSSIQFLISNPDQIELFMYIIGILWWDQLVCKLGELWPCLIRPKPDLDFKIRILKPWGCKQTECWIRIRFHENKCKIWIYFLSRCHYLSILSERIFSKCHCVVSLTFYCEIVDCEMLKQIVWRFHQTLAHRRPPSWIQWIWLRGWFHGFTNPDSVSEDPGLNKRHGFWNRFQFWSNQTGP